jgi:hypothetical protein
LKCTVRWLNGLLCLSSFLFLLSPSTALTDDRAHQVLILPLTIHSQKDLNFLNRGMMDMLASRISPVAIVIREDEVNPGQTPLQLGRDLGTDFVVTGSLTLFGNSTSTDAVLTAVKSGEAVLQYNQFGQRDGDVLMHIDQFGQQVSQYLTSLSATAPVAAPADDAPAMMIPHVAPPAAPGQPTPPAAAAAPAVPIVAENPATAEKAAAPSPPAATAKTVDELWTSHPFKGVISALTTGDIDGDGNTDIVFIHNDQILVERIERRRLTRMAAVRGGRNHTIIAVDAADINGNRMDEIFVTRLTSQGQLDSLVLEWNGTGLAPLADSQRWYFRVINDADKGAVLMGQRQGTPMANDTGGLYESSHFLPGVFELTWGGKDYQAGPRLALPRNTTVYRFTQGDLFNDGNNRTIAYSESDKLRIYDPAGSPQWISSERFGGNPLFLESPSSTDVRTADRTYLTQRLILADLDNDGQMELATVRNRDAARGIVDRFRVYNRGRVVVLQWNQVNLKTVWAGEEINGYIADFSLADMNGDGRQEMVYAMVGSTGLARTKSSNIVIEPIGRLPK